MFHSIIANFIISALLALTFQSDSVQKYPIAPDHSFKAAVYIQKGLPAYDRKWGAKDYEQAVSVLKAIATADPTQLPRYGSPTSGAVFARLVSLDNLSLSRNRTLGQQMRLEAAASILSNVGQITGIYASVTTTEKVFPAELIELFRIMLEASQDVAQLMEAKAASANANQEDRRKGLEEVGEGLAQIVSGCLTTLTEKKTYRSAELRRLAQTLETTLPALMSFLPPGTQQEIPVRLKRMIEEESDSELKEHLTQVAIALTKAKKG